MRIGKKRITACLLSAALLLFTSMIPVQASTALEESIKQKQQAISDAQSEKKKIQSNISDIKLMVNQLQKSKKDLETYVAQLDGQLDDLENKIEDLKEEITAKKTEIEETKADIEQAQAVADQQYEDMKKRIQYLYENGNPSYLELLLTSESMADFLNKSSYAEQMTAYVRNMLEEYIAQKQAVEEKKKELESEKEELDAMAGAASEQKKTVDALIKTKTAQIQSYQDQIDSESSNAEEYKADLAKQQKLLDQIEQQPTLRPVTVMEEPPASYGPVPAVGELPVDLAIVPSLQQARRPTTRALISEHPTELRS